MVINIIVLSILILFYLFETKDFIVVIINANPGYSYKTVIVDLYTYGSLLVTTGLVQPKCPPEISANCYLKDL